MLQIETGALVGQQSLGNIDPPPIYLLPVSINAIL